MANTLANIMDQVVAILEGTATHVGRTIDAGRFRHITVDSVRTGAAAASGAARPFTLEPASITEGPDMVATVTGSNAHGAHLLRLAVLYATRRQEMYALLQEIAGDEEAIRRSLGWPIACREVTGWDGCEVLDIGLEPMGPSDPPDLLGMVVDLRVDYREDWS